MLLLDAPNFLFFFAITIKQWLDYPMREVYGQQKKAEGVRKDYNSWLGLLTPFSIDAGAFLPFWILLYPPVYALKLFLYKGPYFRMHIQGMQIKPFTILGQLFPKSFKRRIGCFKYFYVIAVLIIGAVMIHKRRSAAFL